MAKNKMKVPHENEIVIDQLETSAELANDIVILFNQMKYPQFENAETLKEYITDTDGNYTKSAQELFNYWNEYYFDKLEKLKIT